MGVPKFFRWLSERYPLITIPIEPSFAPEFDNLYLDMNGIIHTCTHPNWNDNLRNSLSEKEMIIQIFHYIDRLFHAVKPQKLIYLALDGVAPRAKMNQQRQRRLRTAQETKEALEKAIEAGEEVSSNDIFDSNCITPGTEFMAKLSKYLNYFICKKLREDSAWKKIKVIFSGHEVPGEGEHKIMDFIRRQKMQPDYDPNTRHCLYGLDADLIMLALVSHEPHFALLREEVTFGRRKKKPHAAPPKFQLLFINLLREYLDEEFKSELPFGYDFERIVDDFVLFCFFVGNDFLPNLPYMDIADGALDNMFDIYKEILPKLGGYITEKGEINWERCEKFLAQIAKTEQQMLSTMPPLHLEVLEQSLRPARDEGAINDNGSSPEVEDALAELDEETVVFEGGLKLKDDTEVGQHSSEDQIRSVVNYDDEDEEDDGSWKNWYYRDKFRVGLENEEFHRRLRHSYLEGLVWVLRYYYGGCCSWNWFFPFHYAPLCSDLVSLTSYEIKFDLGTPFQPFQQLISVLPVRSKSLLPLAYQELMTRLDSPIIDFYPEEFKIDMNGKRNSWEGIALIPFIDEKRLLSAIDGVDKSRLNENEKLRDIFGSTYLYQYDPNNLTLVPSPMPGIFPDINPCLVSSIDYHQPEWGEDGPIAPHLLPGAKFGLQNHPGFPTLQNLRHAASLSYAGLSVFGTSSRNQSLLIKLVSEDENPQERLAEIKNKENAEDPPENEPANAPTAVILKDQPTDQINAVQLQDLLGKTIYVNWPYLKEALVLGISDETCRISQGQGVVKHTPGDAAAWIKECKYQKNHYKAKKGMDIGQPKVLLHVQVLRGMKVRRDGSRTKMWSTSDEIYPFQTILREHYAPDPKLQERPAPTVEESFPIGQCVVYVGPEMYYGGLGTVVEHLPSQAGSPPNVKVKLDNPPPPASFGRRIALQSQESFYHLSEVSKRLNISAKLLSKITASVYAQHQGRKINIGLRIKFTRKGQQMLGYTQRIETPGHGGVSRGYWMYSAKAVNLIAQFMEKFPDLFQALEAQDAQEIEVFSPEMLFHEGDPLERLDQVEEWLKTLETNNLGCVPIGSKAMSKDAVKAIEAESNRYMSCIKERKKKTILVECPTNFLLAPLSETPTNEETSPGFSLGDRVMNLCDTGPIPFGLTGTVTGVVANLLEVVFDEEFLGGTNLDDRCSDLRGLQHIPCTTMLNLTSGYAPSKNSLSRSVQQNLWGRGHHHHSDPKRQGQEEQQHSQSRHQPYNRGGQGADTQGAILSRHHGGPNPHPERTLKKSGDNVVYRPKRQPQGDAPAPAPASAAVAPRVPLKNQPKHSSASTEDSTPDGESTDKATESKQRKRRPMRANQANSEQPPQSQIAAHQDQAGYPMYFPNFAAHPPSTMMPPQPFTGVPPPSALYNTPMVLLGRGGELPASASVSLPGIPVPLQVPQSQQQELVKPRSRNARGRGRGGGRGDAQHQQPQQQWKQSSSSDGTQPVQSSRPRRGKRNGRGGGDPGEQEQEHKDQKDQLTWQQKLLL